MQMAEMEYAKWIIVIAMLISSGTIVAVFPLDQLQTLVLGIVTFILLFLVTIGEAGLERYV